jgi:ABC-type multidrug transport system fused ATPase/permease subunit
VALAAGAIRHWFAVQNWLDGAFRTVVAADAAVTTRGQEIARRFPTGDVVSVTTTDMERVGHVYDVSARFAGAIVSYVVVAVILLRASVPTGLVVLVGAPVLLALLGLIIRPLQRRQAAQREESGRLTTLGTDTVAGLRILRGIGGEAEFAGRYAAQSQRVRAAGVRVAGYQAALDASQTLLPGLFVVLVAWTGARAVVAGHLSTGELVAFYGYATFIVFPLRTVTEMVETSHPLSRGGGEGPGAAADRERSSGTAGGGSGAGRWRRGGPRERCPYAEWSPHRDRLHPPGGVRRARRPPRSRWGGVGGYVGWNPVGGHAD